MSPWFSDLFLNSQSDERLVRLAAMGHQQAFSAIVRRYRRELSRFASRLCAEGKAEDVVQQTFLSAFTALQDGCEVKHLRGWLYAILRHDAARVGVRGVVETELADTALAGLPLEETVSQRMEAFDALSEIERLPDNQRAALLATALEGRSRAEVASLLGLSEGAVRQLVHRARSTVRTAVTAFTPFPLLRWVAVRTRATPTTTAELVAGAGAGGAGSAVVLKLGVVVVAGLGAGSVAGLGAHLTRHSARAVHVASADRRLTPAGSALSLAGFVTPLGAGIPSSPGGQRTGGGRGTAKGGPRAWGGMGGQDSRSGRTDGSGPSGDAGGGQRGDPGGSGSSGGSQPPGSGDSSHGGASGSSGSGDSGGSSGGLGGGGSSSSGSGGSTGSSSGSSGGGSGADGGSMTTSGSSGSGSSGGSGGGGGGGTTTTSTTTDGGSRGGSDGGSGNVVTNGGGTDTTTTSGG